MTVVDMFYKGEHKTPEGKLKIVKIKSGMNNKRTVYTSLLAKQALTSLWTHSAPLYS
jgi:hypothetical protein